VQGNASIGKDFENAFSLGRLAVGQGAQPSATAFPGKLTRGEGRGQAAPVERFGTA
jgi:hypothetical protein